MPLNYANILSIYGGVTSLNTECDVMIVDERCQQFWKGWLQGHEITNQNDKLLEMKEAFSRSMTGVTGDIRIATALHA